MKSIQLAAFFIALSFAFISCSKDGDDEGEDCEEANITTVRFVNGGTATMRVQVAIQLTPQYEPIDPVVTLDLASGESVSKEIPADRYMIVWKNDCPDNCNVATSYAKTYESCQEYTEQLAN
jgi:hypothetical protein